MFLDQRRQRIRILAEIAVVPVDGFAYHRQVAAQYGFLGVLHGTKVARHRNGQQHADDAHDDEQLDQGESAPPRQFGWVTTHDTRSRSVPFPAPGYTHRTHRPPAAAPTPDSCNCAVPRYPRPLRWHRETSDRAAPAAGNTS